MKIKKIITTVSAALAVCACGLSEVDSGNRTPVEDIWKNPAYRGDSTDPERKICYVTGLHYPDGYGWKADPEKGAVKCSLVVFADGMPIMKIPVGDEYMVSPDPDMHRIIDGHIYTDYSTDTETVVKKDGQEIFRHEGREMIIDMKVSEGAVHSLNQPRNGSGFIYRKNGEAVLKRNRGYALPRLQECGDSVCFAFCEPIESSEGILERYHHVMNGKVSQVALRDDIRKVWDVIWYEGEICYIASMTGIDSPVMVWGEELKALEMPQNMKILSCRLIPAGGIMAAEAIYTDGVDLFNGIWKDAMLHHTFPKNMILNGICSWDDGICCALNSDSKKGGGIIFRCGETFTVPEGFTVMGNCPIAVRNGILNVGLSSTEAGRPAIWKDGKMEELNINGCICTLSVQ